MNQYPNAAAGLKLMFIGQILAVVGLLLIWVPLVGSLIVIAGFVVEIVGLYKASGDDEGYRTALMLLAVNVVVNLVAGFMGQGLLASLLSVVGTVLSLLAVIQVCTTTSNLLHSVGSEALSQRGSTVIKLFLVCTVVSIVCSVLSAIPVLNVLAALVSIVAAIAQIVGYILYLMFLHSSSKAL